MLNFVLCDDNLAFLKSLDKTLNKLILKNNFNAKVGFSSDKVSDVLNYINNNHTDVLFLDINLSNSDNGINIAEKIRSRNKNIYLIFTTGHLEFAFLAFQVKAFDYLPKPITAERLEKTLIRLFDDINSSDNKFIQINNRTYINEKDIYYIQKDGMKLLFKTADNIYETYSSFQKISDKLSNNFIRCHKSYIANISNITHIELNNNTLFFHNNLECFIGQKYKDNLLKAINK